MGRGYVGADVADPHRPDVRRHPRGGRPGRPWVRRTPVLEVEVDGRSVALKLELLQHSGSFKVRGAFTQRAVGTRATGDAGRRLRRQPRPGRGPRRPRARASPTRVFVPESRAGRQGGRDRRAGRRGEPRRRDLCRGAGGQPRGGRRAGALALHAYDSFGHGRRARRPSASRSPSRCRTWTPCSSRSAVAGCSPASPAALAGCRRPATRVVAVEPAGVPDAAPRPSRAGEPVDVQVGGVAADALGASRLGRDRLRDRPRARLASLLVRRRGDRRGTAWLWREAGSPRSRPGRRRWLPC